MGQYKKIMISLIGDDSEQPVVDQAYHLANELGARLTAIHVNDLHAGEMSMMMDSPKKVTDEMIRGQIKDYGYESILGELEIIITENESVSKAIEQHCKDFDLLIVGHRKMSEFKSRFMDSIDEGIANLVPCPVLVVLKD
ncbi:MAG: universal stress protein [Candidatus Marinimicrobia bacterium]|jgi:nucleotide-binding universal stress UspA family protein|nr:universal stress protein [Candidatus Neomarinimicrobiota bacterium]|tara:strand:- start:69 stop:488 length:420 start_codon:yes stop_codon:yes gene_type:complete